MSVAFPAASDDLAHAIGELVVGAVIFVAAVTLSDVIYHRFRG